MPQKRLPFSLFCLGAATLSGCALFHGSSTKPTITLVAHPTADVSIYTFQFQPATLTITPGTTVTWTDRDPIENSVVSGSSDNPGGPLDGDLPYATTTYSYTFDTPGEYPYYSVQHPAMNGKIVVLEAPAIPSTQDAMAPSTSPPATMP